ncbi:MAG: hypothetical protein MJB14_11800 [Spirochaetes bacterium]|nr:hypothetical protein [Spirochaetota bacterium]
MAKYRIAYSLCGEGYGHYGRSAGVIRELAKRLPESQIDLYCYANAYEIVTKEKSLPKNVAVYKIPGFKFRHNKKSKIDLFKTFVLERENHLVAFFIIKIFVLQYFVLPIINLFKKKNTIAYRSTKVFFHNFDVAVVDFEALLPRVAKLRNKKFITLDNLHIMLFGKFDLRKYTAKEMFKFLGNKFFLTLGWPVSKPFLLTTIYNYPIRPKYINKVKQIRPLVRPQVLQYKNKVRSDNYILLYLRRMVKNQILPIITQITNYNFVVFVENLTEEERKLYQNDWIEFHDINPAKFLEYLVNCKAVISTGGYTLITESLILKKPYFAIPLGGLFGLEQKLNLNILIHLNCGSGCRPDQLTKEKVLEFLKKIPFYQEHVDQYALNDSITEVADYIIEKLK